MRIHKLTKKAKEELLETILNGLQNYVRNNPENLVGVLEILVGTLDDSDHDFWGTEGWKHTFGVDT